MPRSALKPLEYMRAWWPVLGLRAKLAAVFIPLLIISIVVVSGFEIDRTLAVMTGNLRDAGDLLINETFEQMRAVLSHPAADPVVALRQADGLRALLKSSQALGTGVVYARIDDPGGQIMVSALSKLEGGRAPAATPFAELARRLGSWWPPKRIGALWGDHTYELSHPVNLDRKPFAVIKVGVSTALISAQVKRTVEEISAIGGAACVLSILVAMLFGRLLLSEVSAITSGVEQLAAGSNEVRLDVVGRDELSTLALKFNQLSQRIKTDRTQWENERGQFFNIFRSITDAVMLLDAGGAVLFANGEACERLGLPAGGAGEGKQLTLLLGRKHPLSRMVETAYAAGTEVHDVAVEMREGAEMRRFLVSLLSLGRSGPEPPGLLLIARDLEPVSELESVVDYSGRLARLGGLISGVAHQIRNPLNAMNLHLELLSQDVTSGRSVDARLRAVRKEIGRLDQAVGALMRFMRPEQLKLADLPINDLLKELGGLVARPGVRVEYRLAPLLKPVRADRVLLSEALRNLINNAAEAMPSGGTLTIASAQAADGLAELTIADQGVGIPKENLERIFNLYFTTKKDGTGLGLSLALRAIDLHHGTLSIDSTVGSGTRVTVLLPTADLGERAVSPLPARQTGQA